MSIPKKRMVFTPSFFATALAWENPVTHPALLMCDDSCKLQSEVESWVDGWNTQQIGHRGKRERWTTNETGCFVEDLQHQCLTMAFYKHTAYNLFCKNHTIIWWVVHSDIPAPMHINDLLFNRPVNTVLLHVTSQNAVVYSKNGITVIPARGKSFFFGGLLQHRSTSPWHHYRFCWLTQRHWNQSCSRPPALVPLYQYTCTTDVARKPVAKKWYSNVCKWYLVPCDAVHLI